ncbi:CLUMA_CG001577, isoform A [Clunio marinus]|uniref:CLUMA_CG001577, isoform A n=1 Tax=Clunio marinus TaxID=568069 RepID=A0A1J1HNF2_9DIPT|nr:CLUMA_CG001577, isoform A [Clunio marinus]
MLLVEIPQNQFFLVHATLSKNASVEDAMKVCEPSQAMSQLVVFFKVMSLKNFFVSWLSLGLELGLSLFNVNF